MGRDFFLTTERIGFSEWQEDDIEIDYAFTVLKAEGLFAGHNPQNIASQKILSKLGFHYIDDEFYEPTGLYHPSYELTSSSQ